MMSIGTSGGKLYICSRAGGDIHIGIWESWNEGVQKFETDFDFCCFRDSVTKETIYTEQGSSLITCIHNYTGLMCEKIIAIECDYVEKSNSFMQYNCIYTKTE